MAVRQTYLLAFHMIYRCKTILKIAVGQDEIEWRDINSISAKNKNSFMKVSPNLAKVYLILMIILSFLPKNFRNSIPLALTWEFAPQQTP